MSTQVYAVIEFGGLDERIKRVYFSKARAERYGARKEAIADYCNGVYSQYDNYKDLVFAKGERKAKLIQGIGMGGYIYSIRAVRMFG